MRSPAQVDRRGFLDPAAAGMRPEPPQRRRRSIGNQNELTIYDNLWTNWGNRPAGCDGGLGRYRGGTMTLEMA